MGLMVRSEILYKKGGLSVMKLKKKEKKLFFFTNLNENLWNLLFFEQTCHLFIKKSKIWGNWVTNL